MYRYSQATWYYGISNFGKNLIYQIEFIMNDRVIHLFN